MWCSILNGGLLVFSALIAGFAREFIFRAHNRWYRIQREAFDVAMYSFLGVYKIFIFVFSLVPYVALLIVG
jgi:hypothetical protein